MGQIITPECKDSGVDGEVYGLHYGQSHDFPRCILAVICRLRRERSYRSDWDRELRSPDGLKPNEAVSANVWGGGESDDDA
jgi:hypothetical protein